MNRSHLWLSLQTFVALVFMAFHTRISIFWHRIKLSFVAICYHRSGRLGQGLVETLSLWWRILQWYVENFNLSFFHHDVACWRVVWSPPGGRWLCFMEMEWITEITYLVQGIWWRWDTPFWCFPTEGNDRRTLDYLLRHLTFTNDDSGTRILMGYHLRKVYPTVQVLAC